MLQLGSKRFVGRAPVAADAAEKSCAAVLGALVSAALFGGAQHGYRYAHEHELALAIRTTPVSSWSGRVLARRCGCGVGGVACPRVLCEQGG